MIVSVWDKDWGNPLFQESYQHLKMLHFFIDFFLQKGNYPKFRKIVMLTKESYPTFKWIQEPRENSATVTIKY